MKRGIVLVRGGGDLASGVVLRLTRAGLRILVTELPHPLVVRRSVAFAEAVHRGRTYVEEVLGQRVDSPDEANAVWDAGGVPVLVDEAARVRETVLPTVLVDGRMAKRSPDLGMDAAPLVIGLGPGFIAGENCHAVIETQRGHTLGRVIWAGAPEPDTGVPETVLAQDVERVLRAPAAGKLRAFVEIGQRVEPGERLAAVNGHAIRAPFRGVLRGILFPGTSVTTGMKIGDLDPRGDPEYCRLVSDKALAIGGGVLEAILSQPAIRPQLWSD